jgi:hypothetical protein
VNFRRRAASSKTRSVGVAASEDFKTSAFRRRRHLFFERSGSEASAFAKSASISAVRAPPKRESAAATSAAVSISVNATGVVRCSANAVRTRPFSSTHVTNWCGRYGGTPQRSSVPKRSL